MSYPESYFQRSEDNVRAARAMPYWRRFALLSFAGMLAMMAGLGFSQRDVRAVRHQAVQACDAGWEACRASSGFPVKSAAGCTWRHRDATYQATEFGRVDAKGAWTACKWTDEPDEEAEEDESSCGVGWRVCFGMVTR